MDKYNADIAQTQRLIERKFAQMEKSIKPLAGGIRLLSTAMLGLGAAGITLPPGL